MPTEPTCSWQVDWPLYSCDDHIDMWALPADVWTSRLAATDHDDCPRVIDRDGVATWVADGRVLGVAGSPTSGANSALVRAGLGHDPLRPSDPAKRLDDMARDGVYASVIYGPAVMGLPIRDPELKARSWRAWNDFATHFNSYDSSRLALLPVLPTHTPAAAVAELERVAALGHRGALVYCFDFDCGDPAWQPLWATAAATGLPISFHIGGGVSTIPIDPTSWSAYAFSAVVPMSLCEPLAKMLFCGALERNPDFKLVVAEAGLGWLPYFVNRAEGAFRKRTFHARDFQPQVSPLELFRNQVFVTFEEEVNGAAYIDMLGAGSFMWASDYPHGDSTFPESRRAIAESFGGLSEADCRQITAGNCRQLYRFN